MKRRFSILTYALAAMMLVPARSRADDLIYSYDCDIFPYEDGWTGFGCELHGDCVQYIEDGHFVLTWPTQGDGTNYKYSMPFQPETLWVEWAYRSNHPFQGLNDSCDGWTCIRYDLIFECILFYGDIAFSFSGDDTSGFMELEKWHYYRFESDDGVHLTVSVDGKVFFEKEDISAFGGNFIQILNDGGCNSNWIPNIKNEWDFVRYGEITYGEEIVATAPPGGVLSPVEHGNLTQFAVTYDSPNYVYVDEVSVTTTAPLPNGESPPQVHRTGRYDNGSPDTVVITLDKPIPLNGETTFTFFDGVITGDVTYSFKPGDGDGDGDVDLADYAAFANCFAPGPAGSEPEGICTLFDVAGNPDFPRVGLPDFAAFADIITGPNE